MKVLNSFGFSNFQPILGVYAFLSHWNEKKPRLPVLIILKNLSKHLTSKEHETNVVSDPTFRTRQQQQALPPSKIQ